jgi:hypothetical protein
MCTLDLPFRGRDQFIIQRKIKDGTYTKLPGRFTPEMHQFVAALLTKEASKRPNITQILNMAIIKNRIRNFLNENEFNNEFSHTVLHKFNPLKDQNPTFPPKAVEEKNKIKDQLKAKNDLEKNNMRIKKNPLNLNMNLVGQPSNNVYAPGNEKNNLNLGGNINIQAFHYNQANMGMGNGHQREKSSPTGYADQKLAENYGQVKGQQENMDFRKARDPQNPKPQIYGYSPRNVYVPSPKAGPGQGPNVSEFNLDFDKNKDPNYNRYNAQHNFNQKPNTPYGAPKYDRQPQNPPQKQPDYSPMMQNHSKVPTPQSYQDYGPIYPQKKFAHDPTPKNLYGHNQPSSPYEVDHLDGFYEKYIKQKPDEELHVRREKFFDKLSY